jgi:3-hydroxyisobutyrate dehydrogenase
VALLGLGEAGSAIARGLCSPGGWRESQIGRKVIAIDIEPVESVRGRVITACGTNLDLVVERNYTQILSSADLVISVVTGEDALKAARMARDWLRPGTLFADFNSITGSQTKAVAAELTLAGIDFVDVAVMGSFMAMGHLAPLLISGPSAQKMVTFAEEIGTPARILSNTIGDASAVKILRSILMKGIEALSVECLVAARRQGLVDHVLSSVNDVDKLGFAEFVRVLTITHLTHAKRRMEEVEKAALNLEEAGVQPLMSEAILRSHKRTVDAALDPKDLADLDLNAALRILDEVVHDAGSVGKRRLSTTAGP